MTWHVKDTCCVAVRLWMLNVYEYNGIKPGLRALAPPPTGNRSDDNCDKSTRHFWRWLSRCIKQSSCRCTYRCSRWMRGGENEWMALKGVDRMRRGWSLIIGALNPIMHNFVQSISLMRLLQFYFRLWFSVDMMEMSIEFNCTHFRWFIKCDGQCFLIPD